MKTKLSLICFLLAIIGGRAVAQQQLVYNHYYLNPFLYNPSYIAPSGYSELYINYRKQWSGIEGAPTTGTLNFHLPLSHKAGVAFTAYKDKAGLLNTTGGMASFSYQIYLGKLITDIHKLSFGMSAGVMNSRIDANEADDISDPVIGNNTSSLDGQFGLHYQYNNFKIGFAIPRIFETKVASEENFNLSGISSLNNTISSISYDFKLGPSFSIEPMVSYFTSGTLDSHYEVLANFKLANAGWIGGAFREGYGATAFLGVNLKEKIKVAYAYEFATDQTDRIGNGSHEVQLVVRLGKKQFSRPQTSKTTPPTVVEAETEDVAATEPEVQEPEAIESETTEPVIAETLDKTVNEPLQVEQPITQSQANHAGEGHHGEPDTTRVDITQHTVTTMSGEGLAPGHYVVVGAFHNLLNAKNFNTILQRSGYPSNIAFHPGKGYYIVHMDDPSLSIEEAKVVRDKYRQMSRYSFRDTWILSIE